MKKDENMIKAGAKLVRQHLQLDIIADHGKNILFYHHQPFACKP